MLFWENMTNEENVQGEGAGKVNPEPGVKLL
jgi:hypothetical protein